MGDWGEISDQMYNPGDRAISVKKVQELRGTIIRWGHGNKFWRYMESPIDALTFFSDSTETWIRCDNDEMELFFWGFMKMARCFDGRDELRRSCFNGKLAQAISAPPNELAIRGEREESSGQHETQ